MDECYGDKELAVLSTMYRLESLELPQGPEHGRIEALASEVRIARTRLKAVGAEGKMYARYFTIGMFKNKLNEST